MRGWKRRSGEIIENYIIKEEKFERRVFEALEKEFGGRACLHPLGGRDVDIGILKIGTMSSQKSKPEEIEIFVEVKGTEKPSGEPFTDIQNPQHLAVGIFQLMRRIRYPYQRGRLYLPYHEDFEKKLKEARITLERSGLNVYFWKENENEPKLFL